MGGRSGFVDEEAHSAAGNDEMDHAAFRPDPGIGDGEDRMATQREEDASGFVGRTTADEGDMASLRSLGIRETSDKDASPVDHLRRCSLVDQRAERIAPDHAQDEGLVRGRLAAVGPSHVTGEFRQESRLDSLRAGLCRPGRRKRPSSQQRRKQEKDAVQNLSLVPA